MIQICIVLYTDPDITAVEVNEICTNDFTVSWTPASTEVGVSYIVTLQSDVNFGDSTMDTSYNFTGLTPNTEYSVSIVGILNLCSGTPIMLSNTTVTVEAGVPQSKLIDWLILWICMHLTVCTYVCI